LKFLTTLIAIETCRRGMVVVGVMMLVVMATIIGDDDEDDDKDDDDEDENEDEDEDEDDALCVKSQYSSVPTTS
jgi:hypothetical protein